MISSNIAREGFHHPRCSSINNAFFPNENLQQFLERCEKINVEKRTSQYVQCWGKSNDDEPTSDKKKSDKKRGREEYIVYFCEGMNNVRQTTRFILGKSEVSEDMKKVENIAKQTVVTRIVQ